MNRIGDILVGANAITASVRDKALAHRGKAKIRFGTALLETNAISEALLLRALSIQRQATPVAALDLAEIRPDILRLVPSKLAGKLLVIPFRRVGRNVSLAMRDPADLPAVDEVAFLTGLQITPHLALEFRLYRALAKHYGLAVDQRFIDLAQRLDQQRAAAAKPAPPSSLYPTVPLPAPVPPPSGAPPPPPAPAPPPRPVFPPPPVFSSPATDPAVVPLPPSVPPGAPPGAAPPPLPVARPLPPVAPPEPPTITATIARVAAPPPPPPPIMDRRASRAPLPPPPGFSSHTRESSGFHVLSDNSDPWSGIPEAPVAAGAPVFTEINEAWTPPVPPVPVASPESAPPPVAVAPSVAAAPRAEPANAPEVDTAPIGPEVDEALKRMRGTTPEEDEAAEASAPAEPATAETPAAEEPTEEPPLEEAPADLVTRLARAESRDEIADAVLDASTQHAVRAALFIVQADRIIGWAARPEPPEGFRTFSLKFSDTSIFSTLRNTEGFYSGPCPELPANARILKAIGTEKAGPITVVPITLRGKSVLFFLAENEHGGATPALQPLKRLGAMTATALEIILLKNRLRQM